MVRMGDAAHSYRKGTVLKGCVGLAMGVISNRDREQVHAIKSQAFPARSPSEGPRTYSNSNTRWIGSTCEPVRDISL